MISGLRKNIISLALIVSLCTSFCFAEIPSREEYASGTSESPFALSVPLDVSLMACGAAVCGTGFLMQKLMDLPEYNERTYVLSDVNALDAFFAQPYSETLHQAGNVLCAVNLAVLPAAVFGTEFLSHNFPMKEFLTLGIMYAESYSLSWGLKNILKVSALRPRPYMYFEIRDTDAFSDHDFEFSWPSGHSTSSFMSATFLTYTFCKYFPDSVWKIPVGAASYSVAVCTAVMRMASGNHFLTDVLTGAVLGSACGFLVPFSHSVMAQKKSAGKEAVQLSFVPAGVNVHIEL